MNFPRTSPSRPRRALSAAAVVLLAGSLALVPSAAHAAPASDDFDRPDGPLGSAWTTLQGSITVAGGRATAAPTAYHDALLVGAHGTRISVEAQAARDISYVGLIAGFDDMATAYMVKLQDNDADGLFETYFVYNNLDTSRSFLAMGAVTPTEHARIALEMTSASGVFTIDSDVDGVPDASINVAFTVAATPAAGLSLFGGATADNFLVDHTPVTLSAPSSFDTATAGDTFVVTADAGGTAPPGTVTLALAGQPDMSVALVNGEAEMDLAGVPAGTYTYTATFPNGSGYESARVSGTIVVAAEAATAAPAATLAETGADDSIWMGAALLLASGFVLVGLAARRRAT